jgi:outer membrane protein assembly factor BamB
MRRKVTDTHIAWRLTENTPDVCTPLVYKGKLFVLDGDKKVMTCLDPKTGKQIWKGELGVREVFKSSPTGADDKIYCISERGTVVVLSTGDEFKILSKTEMGDQPNRSSIAIAQGQLFVCTAKTLYCIGKK